MEDPVVQVIFEKYMAIKDLLDERTKRVWAGAEARALGRGGVARVMEATGMSRARVTAGVKEVEAGGAGGVRATGRVRAAGGGRKRLAERDPGLEADLEKLVDPATRGDPEGPLLWTSLGTEKLAEALRGMGHEVSGRTVARMLRALGYRLQANRKTTEGRQHPDRDGQFNHINRRAAAFRRRGDPVVSVDTKKKELIGDFHNGGREWRPRGDPEKVRVHDFKDEALGKAVPYGVCDVAEDAGWVSVGVDHDTAEFAAETLRRWWRNLGATACPESGRVLVTADAGGSNGARSRLWKAELQRFADETGLKVSVCHFPPGTSKWNKIEHRMFSRITRNWRGRPLVSREAVVELIANTTTRRGLTIRAELDENEYPTGIKVTDEEMAALKITRDKFHGEWNYTISPRRKAVK